MPTFHTSAPPEDRVVGARRVAVLLFVAYSTLIATFQGIQNILVPGLVQQIAPQAKVSSLAILSTISAATTIVAFLVGGAISDRTRTRWGRRTPSLVGSCALSVALMLMMSVATTMTQLVILMPMLWFSSNYYQTVLTAILPDRIPEAERGFASSAIGLGVPVGLFVGVNVAAIAPTPITAYGLLAAMFALGTLALVWLGHEPSSLGVSSIGARGAEPARTPFLSAFASRDFTLTFVSRFLLFLAYFTVAGYLLYVLQDYVGVAHLPGGSANAAVGIVFSVTTIAWLVITPATGFIADRMGRTAGIVAVTSIAIGLVMLVPAMSSSWVAMIVFGIGLGLTFGIYFALDLKLASIVLPSAETAGRDIGILGVAGSGPTVVAPALAAGIISYAGFPALFLFGSVVALAGGLSAFLIRTRR